jgi:hypothetical protein
MSILQLHVSYNWGKIVLTIKFMSWFLLAQNYNIRHYRMTIRNLKRALSSLLGAFVWWIDRSLSLGPLGPYVGGATTLEDMKFLYWSSLKKRFRTGCVNSRWLHPNFSNLRHFLALTLSENLAAADGLRHRFCDPFHGMPEPGPLSLPPSLPCPSPTLCTPWLRRDGGGTASREHQGWRRPHRPTITCWSRAVGTCSGSSRRWCCGTAAVRRCLKWFTKRFLFLAGLGASLGCFQWLALERASGGMLAGLKTCGFW